MSDDNMTTGDYIEVNWDMIDAFSSKLPTPCGEPSATTHDATKPRLSLVPHAPLQELNRVNEFGAAKYGDRNWMQGLPYSRWYDAAQRHLMAFWSGEDKDPESGLHHLAHAAFSLFALQWQQAEKPELDDRGVKQ